MTAALALALALAARSERAKTLLDESVSRDLPAQNPYREGQVLHLLARASLALGRMETAGDLGERALATATTFGERANEAEARLVLGMVAASASDPDLERLRAADRHIRAALAIAAALGMRPFIAHCRFHLSGVLSRLGRSEDAAAETDAAIALYRAMEMRAPALTLPP